MGIDTQNSVHILWRYHEVSPFGIVQIFVLLIVFDPANDDVAAFCYDVLAAIDILVLSGHDINSERYTLI